jgi:hypothetical protein
LIWYPVLTDGVVWRGLPLLFSPTILFKKKNNNIHSHVGVAVFEHVLSVPMDTVDTSCKHTGVLAANKRFIETGAGLLQWIASALSFNGKQLLV